MIIKKGVMFIHNESLDSKGITRPFEIYKIDKKIKAVFNEKNNGYIAPMGVVVISAIVFVVFPKRKPIMVSLIIQIKNI